MTSYESYIVATSISVIIFQVIEAYSIFDLERSSTSFSRSPTERSHKTSYESVIVTRAISVFVFKLLQDLTLTLKTRKFKKS